MDTWPPTIISNSTQGEKNRKGKTKATPLPYPLLEGGALTSATLREEGDCLEWIAAQNRASSRKLVCNDKAVLTFPATRPPQPRQHPRKTSLLRRAEQGAHFLRTYYPDVDIPAELIREQVGAEAQLEDSLRVFDPLIGDLVTSFHVSNGSRKPWSFMAFPMGENGCDLNFSSIDFSAEESIVTEPSHYPVKTFETPICQIVSSPVSIDLTKETVVGVRTFSSTLLSSLSLSTSKQRTSTSVEMKEIGLIYSSSLNGHVAVDVEIHSSLEYAALVNDQGQIFKHSLLGGSDSVKVFGASEPDDTSDDFWRIALGEHRETCFLISSKSVQLVDFRAAKRSIDVYSLAGAPDLLTSIKCVPDDDLSQIVTTNELIWVDTRHSVRPMLAWKHERERDRTLSSHAVRIGGSTFTVLSSRKNGLLSVYDVSRDKDKDALLQSHALPYNLPGHFPNGPHAGFYVAHPHPESSNAKTVSLAQLTSRGALYQTALALRQSDETSSPITIDVSWSAAVHRLAAASGTQQPDVGKLGARAVQEVDFRQVYQRLFSPLDATEAVYPAENADAVYQTLDIMPLFWQETSTAHEHLLTTFDIVFRSGEEPIHASRADFLTQSALSSRRGFRALAQGRVPREMLIKGAAWHVNLGPVIQRFVPDIADDIQLVVERLRRYDLVLDDYRSGSSLRRESESREQLAVDLALSTDVYSAQPFTKAETELTEDEKLETMSRAAEAMTLSEMELPSVHFGYLNPVPAMTHNSPSEESTSLTLPTGVRLLLSEWVTGTDPDRYTYRDPYDDRQPGSASAIVHRTPIRRNGGGDGTQITQTQSISMAPPVIASSRVGPLTLTSSSQPIRRVTGDDPECRDIHPDSYVPAVSTQVLPGPFGGRPMAARKKAALGKKRIGGF